MQNLLPLLISITLLITPLALSLSKGTPTPKPPHPTPTINHTYTPPNNGKPQRTRGAGPRSLTRNSSTPAQPAPAIV